MLTDIYFVSVVVVVFFFIRKNDCGYFKKPKGNVLVSEIKLMIIMISRRRSSAVVCLITLLYRLLYTHLLNSRISICPLMYMMTRIKDLAGESVIGHGTNVH